MIAAAGSLVGNRKLSGGKTASQIDLGRVDGTRARRIYAIKAGAELALEEHNGKQSKHGTSLADLNRGEVAEILLARSQLAGAGATISHAVEFYLRHGIIKKGAFTINKLARLFLDKKETTTFTCYHRQLKVSLGSLVRHRDNTPSHEIRKPDMEEWLECNQWKPKTRNNYLGGARAMFAWGQKKGMWRLTRAQTSQRPGSAMRRLAR